MTLPRAADDGAERGGGLIETLAGDDPSEAISLKEHLLRPRDAEGINQ